MNSDFIEVRSWGNTCVAKEHPVFLAWLKELPDLKKESCLAYGMGRSYGDVCLNDGGTLLSTRWLDKLIQFDDATGILRCEAGTTLEDIIRVFLPKGYFLPVSLGTKQITVGGAIANDVHGKNHHNAGTFGRHIKKFELLRTEGRIVCSPEENQDLYQATIGGMGLTGLILWADIQLRPDASSYLEVEQIPFSSLEEYFQIAQESDRTFEHTSAWADFTSGGNAFGRGIFFRGNFSAAEPQISLHKTPCELSFYAPESCLNRLSMKCFNRFYFRKGKVGPIRRLVHYDPFFFPLDVIGQWNRLYGRRGFFQYQCLFPKNNEREAVNRLVLLLKKSSVRPYLTVLKSFGSLSSPGIMSFPMEGLTIALDFPNQGTKTRELMEEMDRLVAHVGGRVYPAKDARMSAQHFQQFFPAVSKFSSYVDPHFSSNLWKRVTNA